MGIEYEASDIDKAISYIRSGLDISLVTTSHMIQISKMGSDPAEITEIVNTIVQCYIVYHIEARKMTGSIDSYEEQLAFHEKEIYALEETIKEFQKRWFVISAVEQHSFHIKLLQILEESRSMIRANIVGQQTKLASLADNLMKKGASAPMTEEYRNSDALTELLKVYLPLLLEKERTALLYKEASAEYQDMKKQAEKFRAKIFKEQKRILKGAQLDSEAQVKSEKALSLEIDRIRGEAELLKEKEVELNRLTRKLERNKKSYALYLNKIEEARIAESRELARVSNIFVSNWASKPSKPVSPNKKVTLLLVLPVGVIAGIGAAFAAFYLDHTIKRPEDLERCSGIPVFASLGIIRH
ncbi:MAG: hypothetical protein D3924_15610 [Candidatus Electrothrix sp. AR4]|nr:hypothetical protein [Candidatus Electrothrix sp. AR4]